jgi:AcrR family transcriptional regulator
MGVRMRSVERRASIVRSASRLFAEKGFRGATTRELASALGVTEPVLYQHFRAKRDLYSAIIEAKAAEGAAHAGTLVELSLGSDDRAFFSAVGELLLERYEHDPEMFRLLFFSCLERHDLAGLFYERLFLVFYKLVTGYIRRRVRAGAFRKVNADLAARGLIGMLSYHGQLGMLFPGRFGKRNRRKVVEEMVEVFLRGISVPPAPAESAVGAGQARPAVPKDKSNGRGTGRRQ